MSSDSSCQTVKICMMAIHDRPHQMSDVEFSNFVETIMPVFKDTFPDIEFMFMSQELKLITTGLHELEWLLFEIKNAIDELKQMRVDSSHTTVNQSGFTDENKAKKVD